MATHPFTYLSRGLINFLETSNIKNQKTTNLLFSLIYFCLVSLTASKSLQMRKRSRMLKRREVVFPLKMIQRPTQTSLTSRTLAQKMMEK